MNTITRIAIIGGGPSGLFMLKRLAESGNNKLEISIFEKNDKFGCGMPYSADGARTEHITNVSGNEIPKLETSLLDWLQTLPAEALKKYGIDKNNFSDYRTLPRLLFGDYLSEQFECIYIKAQKAGIKVQLHKCTAVKDMADNPDNNSVTVFTGNNEELVFDKVIICTGHNWPRQNEGKVPGFFDSPYPPKKLALKINYPVAIKGASLTAIDAVRTIARSNGQFSGTDNTTVYSLDAESEGLKIDMYSLHGFMPAVRFHLYDSHFTKDILLNEDDVAQNRNENGGFLSLDFVFEKNFKEPLKKRDPHLYEAIKNLPMEAFVQHMMKIRASTDAFDLLTDEYEEAQKSIEKKQPVHWKEMLAALSFAMNHPAKHFSAEDMLRLQKTLMPLISLVIAFVPQASVREMLALHNAGILRLFAVENDSLVEADIENGGAVYFYTDAEGNPAQQHYNMYVNSTGQPHFNCEDFIFKTLIERQTVSSATVKFKDKAAAIMEKKNGNAKVIADADGNFYLKVPGIIVNDNYQLINKYGAANERIYLMAVPYMSGYNPDYSGLDFCEAASGFITKSILGKD